MIRPLLQPSMKSVAHKAVAVLGLTALVGAGCTSTPASVLALPQYLVVAVFAGGWGAGFNNSWGWASDGGLIALLALIAAVVLGVRGRYPESIFDLVMGMNRWCFRVLAYAALMRDEYPPFRLDSGGTDPGSFRSCRKGPFLPGAPIWWVPSRRRVLNQ